MKRGIEKRRAIIIIFILLLMIISIPTLLFPEFIGYIIKEPKNQVEFYFYEESTNCPLNGYVFSGDKLLGKTNQGYFNLTFQNYKDNFNINSNLSLFGELDSCFGDKQGLYFDKYWKSFEIQEEYFKGDAVFDFKAEIKTNNPAKRALLGFVQPRQIKDELNKINIKQETLSDLFVINQFLNNKITYVKDWDFNKENYWQTPPETLRLMRGDCEDYSSTLLSLFLAYDSSLNCYNVIFSSHVTTFCYIENYYIYYDQQRLELKKQVKEKRDLEKLKNDYFKHYGIDDTEPRYAFNENQFVEFANEEEYIDWQYSLNKKEEFDIFEILEQQTLTLERKYPTEDLELETRKPETNLPTLKGFFYKNPLLLSSLAIIFFTLLIILVLINIKKN